MIVTVSAAQLEQLADLAFDEAQRHPSRSPGRRAASHLWISCTIPPARSADAVQRALRSFGEPSVQQAAAELLHRFAAQLAANGTQCRIDPSAR